MMYKHVSVELWLYVLHRPTSSSIRCVRETMTVVEAMEVRRDPKMLEAGKARGGDECIVDGGSLHLEEAV